MLIQPIKTRIFKLNESLEDFVLKYLPKVPENSIVVITSKIMALSEGRLIRIKNREEKVEWIKRESQEFIETKWCYLTLKNGHWCANAGIDESNVEGGGIILLPKNIDQSAASLRRRLMQHYKVKNLGILITDSRVFPLRAGVTGVALGYAGFSGIRSYIGKKDLFGRKLKMTQTNIADSLASAAVLVSGEGDESRPLALITDAMVEFRAQANPDELGISAEDDLYRPLFERIRARRTRT